LAEIIVRGVGGHGASPENTKDPISMCENIIWLMEEKCDINQRLLIGSRVNRLLQPGFGWR
jgi:metal-dependent amidase/aminoacylase/carboxypeptidase family protein